VLLCDLAIGRVTLESSTFAGFIGVLLQAVNTNASAATVQIVLFILSP